METMWKCSDVDCDGQAVTGWSVPDPRLVCAEHRDQLADRRAVAIPTGNGGMTVQLLTQYRRP
ncbi:hypothetical protein [Geodermatophilus sp. TF02-6]|uniref:hypothetical protein n=1 Tax=Geodermatophilus sp. TF02-6 TaxID=2250575 RepID=UPI0011BF0DD8|nr:hypothetical protein [Geodermatophilus sp. TF02-6]